jgi:hypothetical protein
MSGRERDNFLFGDHLAEFLVLIAQPVYVNALHTFADGAQSFS